MAARNPEIKTVPIVATNPNAGYRAPLFLAGQANLYVCSVLTALANSADKQRRAKNPALFLSRTFGVDANKNHLSVFVIPKPTKK